MATGADARVGIAKETTYGTRVAPARFLPLTAEDLGFEFNRYFSPAIGTGRWARPSVVTSKIGRGSFSGDVPTVGFGFLVDGLHNNTVTPVQQASTTAYLQTHTLDTPINKSYSVQVQTPPVSSATLVPHDMLGVVFGGLTLSWDTDGVLSYQIPVVYQDLSLAQSLASFTPPSAYSLFSGTATANTVTIGGSAVANIIGSGSIAINYNLREVNYLGGGGLVAKPIESDKPTAEGNLTADFEDNSHVQRTLDNVVADVVVKFQHPTVIASTHYPYVEVTLPDCVFTTNRPTVSGPGPVEQGVTFTAASSTNDPPVVKIMSTEVTL